MSYITDAIRYVAKHDPGRHALVVANRYIVTYANLAEDLDAVRSVLDVMNPAEVMVIDLDNPRTYVVYLLAALDRGLSVLPLTPQIGPDARTAISNDIRWTPTPGQPSLLHITSGSTGSKKYIVRSLGNLVDEAQGVASALSLCSTSRLLVTTPLQHSYGCGLLRAVLVSGATLYTLPPDNIYVRASLARQIVTSEAVDIVTGVPYIFHLLLRDWPAGRGVRVRCFAGGEPLSNKLASNWLDRTGSFLRQEYGLSEGGITTFASEKDDPLSIGGPIPGVNISISSEGELVVYRPYNPVRYYFGEDPDTFQSDGGIRTGDLGYSRDRRFYLTGRRKSIIIVAGMKAVPTEIEEAIREFEDVEDAAVVGIPHDKTGERIVALVQRRSKPRNSSASGLVKYLHTRLESYKVPSQFFWVPELPRTSSGKVDRVAIAGALR